MDISYEYFKADLKGALDYIGPWERDALKSFRFAALKQWDDVDERKLISEHRPPLVFDKTRVIIDSVAGTEQMNRNEAKFYPRNLQGEDIDDQAAEAYEELHRWIRQTAMIAQQESQAFRDALICGVGCTDTFMDYHGSPQGRLVTQRVPIFQVLWDPDAVDMNFRDADFVIRDKWIAEEEFKELYPDYSGYKISDTHEQGIFARAFARVTNRDNAAYSGRQSGATYYDPHRKKVHVWEYQVRRSMPYVYILVPTAEGFMPLEVKKSKKDEVLQDVHEQVEALRLEGGLPEGVEITYNDFFKHEYQRAIVAGKEILEQEEDPIGDFSLKFMTAFEDWSEPQTKRYFGLMKPMRGPQEFYNKFLSQAIHIWSTSPHGALLYEPGFFINEEEARTQIAQPDAMIPVNHGQLSTGKPKFERLEARTSFSGSEPLFQVAQASITDASGVNPNVTAGLAQDVRRAATSALQLIQQQNMSTLAGPFDSLKLYHHDHALLALSFAREYFSDDIIVRVLGPAKAQLTQLTRDEMVETYDIVIEEAPTSPNRQMQVLETLVQTDTIGTLLNSGYWPPSGWKYLGLPEDLARDIEKMHATMLGIQLQAEQPLPAEGGETAVQ